LCGSRGDCSSEPIFGHDCDDPNQDAVEIISETVALEDDDAPKMLTEGLSANRGQLMGGLAANKGQLMVGLPANKGQLTGWLSAKKGQTANGGESRESRGVETKAASVVKPHVHWSGMGPARKAEAISSHTGDDNEFMSEFKKRRQFLEAKENRRCWL
jgi:hypothetical protein